MDKTFKITIGSSPHQSRESGCSTYLEHDLQLIKAALLYADKVEVCSPMGNLIHSINSLRKLSKSVKFSDKVKLLDTILTYNFARPELANFVNALKLLENKKHLSGNEILLKKKFIKEIDLIFEEFQQKDFELTEGDQIKEILKLYEGGLIEYYFFNVNHENLKAKLMDQFSEFITSAIADPYSYALLDDLSGRFIESKISSGEIQISESDIEKNKQVSLASKLFERLPNFDLASLDEIIDIRKELNPYLSKFRSGMIELSEHMKNSPWSEDFVKDVERVFRKNIQPSISELEEVIKTKTYLKSLVSRFAEKSYQFPIPIFGVTIAGQISNFELLSLIADAVILGSNLLDIYNQLEKEKLYIKQNQLFFYYRAKSILLK